MRLARDELVRKLECALLGTTAKEDTQQSHCLAFKGGKCRTFNGEESCLLALDIGAEGVVPAKPLVSMLSLMTDDQVEITNGNGCLTVKGKGGGQGRVQMETEITMPLAYLEKPGEWKPLPAEFSDAVALVKDCAADSKEQQELVVECVHVHPEWVEAMNGVSICRYRLATPVSRDFLVRKRSVENLSKLNVTEISESDSWVHFRNSEGAVFSCRRHLEEYNDYSDALAQEGKPILLPPALAAAARRAGVFSAENVSVGDKVLVQVRAGKIRVIGEGAKGEWRDPLNCQYQGPPLDFYIAPKMLEEIVSKHTKAQLLPGRLRVDGGSWVFVACLGKVEKDQADAGTGE